MRISTSARPLLTVVLTLGLASMLGGCGLKEWADNGFKVGPNYKTPPAPVASHWIDYQSSDPAELNQSAQLQQWWRAFDDPVLNALVGEAYHQNLSLKAAAERIEQARAVRGIAVGNLFPQTQELAGGYGAAKGSDKAGNPLPNDWFRDAGVGFNLGWEIDFWGRFRRAVESADAALEASIANYDNVLVVLIADVAANYIQYRTFQERLALARLNVRVQEDAYQLASDTFKFGRATERDVQQARQILEQTRSLIPQLEIGLRRTNNALCVLLGTPPEDLARILGDSGLIPTGQPDWGVGIPADLLRRRPDVRRAEREAAAQSAIIGIAKSDFYPTVSLLGSIGLNSEEFSDLFKTTGSMTFFAGPAFQWKLLNYGRIENSVKLEEARFRQLVLTYQQVVLNAGREVEDSLTGYVKNKERVVNLTDSVSAAKRTLEITYDQYKQGVVDFTPVFIFEASLTSQQDILAQARGDIALSLVDLFRSLGGGWEQQQNPDTFSAPPTTAPTTQRTPLSRPAALTTQPRT